MAERNHQDASATGQQRPARLNMTLTLGDNIRNGSVGQLEKSDSVESVPTSGNVAPSLDFVPHLTQLFDLVESVSFDGDNRLLEERMEEKVCFDTVIATEQVS